MAATGKALNVGAQLTTGAVTYYTAGTGVQTRIDKCTVCNTTGAAQTFDIYLVPSSGSAGVTNQVIQDRSVNAGETYTCPEVVGQWLNTGQTFQALASAGTALTLRVSGVEVT